MFDISGDDIAFENRTIARIVPSAWPTLRDRIEDALLSAKTEDERVNEAALIDAVENTSNLLDGARKRHLRFTNERPLTAAEWKQLAHRLSDELHAVLIEYKRGTK